MKKGKQKILVALSGGVDSAVTLFLLKKQGYLVEAAYMKNFSERINIKGSCPWREDREEAYRVATKLNVPMHTFDFQKEYHDRIVDYIFETYRLGQTPNPDVLCNNEIKFKLFLEKAHKMGFDKIATGHYAQVKRNKKYYHLIRGKDSTKDQSYFLAGLEQWQLARALFPVGGLLKSEVRKIARRAHLPNAQRPDSQGICFIGKIKLADFLAQKIKPKKGDIVDIKGRKLGEHRGVWFYTIGQRHGLNIGGSGPWYVAKKDIRKNRLVVAKITDPELYVNAVKVSGWHWVAESYKLPLKTSAQIRYRQEPQKCVVYKNKVDFVAPQKGVASGQTIALYKKNKLIASANVF
ncbi:MAG: tRNA 2-thiouridine(34) synthase MnmA [Parcubacteria group bacterium]|nr:MAG: tRNA 2-thiouridine(34) synthase MnmA [Parcubacteria group bacterium]